MLTPLYLEAGRSKMMFSVNADLEFIWKLDRKLPYYQSFNILSVLL